MGIQHTWGPVLITLAHATFQFSKPATAAAVAAAAAEQQCSNGVCFNYVWVFFFIMCSQIDRNCIAIFLNSNSDFIRAKSFTLYTQLQCWFARIYIYKYLCNSIV